MAQPLRPRTAEILDLAPHPEGGWYRETWRAAPESRPRGYPGPRAAATGIYFLLAPGEESAWHRVRSDEVWLWHRGGPLTLLDGGDGDQPSEGPATALVLSRSRRAVAGGTRRTAGESDREWATTRSAATGITWSRHPPPREEPLKPPSPGGNHTRWQGTLMTGID